MRRKNVAHPNQARDALPRSVEIPLQRIEVVAVEQSLVGRLTA